LMRFANSADDNARRSRSALVQAPAFCGSSGSIILDATTKLLLSQLQKGCTTDKQVVSGVMAKTPLQRALAAKPFEGNQ
jgi:hypothetical protein